MLNGNSNKVIDDMVEAAWKLCHEVEQCHFESIKWIYNPLNYAWNNYRLYIETYASTPKKIVFWGLNPGPWGMAQTGIPFGEIRFVRDWMGLSEIIKKPSQEHPKRPIEGLQCQKSEVSGRRLWTLFAERYGSASLFFQEHFVENYCPLVFMEESGKNKTPDQLSRVEKEPLFEACDKHFKSVVKILRPEWVIGIGKFVYERAKMILKDENVKVVQILHPSPASPLANRNWQAIATQQLLNQGVWSS